MISAFIKFRGAGLWPRDGRSPITDLPDPDFYSDSVAMPHPPRKGDFLMLPDSQPEERWEVLSVTWVFDRGLAFDPTLVVEAHRVYF